ncbi:hypothetical protein M197_gp35 [Haloarcula hispanica tailed virus 2]|uniref:Uncharacterized protein n=1 Tax=Haloarcula hispanica tailed virus 2 TaxID=1273751 RepID=R4T8J1_9CAUD|nr:hypothetical protein M197_gp35 [Haloarcula hispanica tailed virus 2]AGM11200.1 hypothetical protein HHTV2_35 [Haloarcula hispanica tailed virus 2]
MTDQNHVHITKDEEYEAVFKEMAKDGARSERQREVEAAFGQSLPALLRELRDNTDSKSAMLRRINNTLEANGVQTKLSRGTLYNWLDNVVDDD